MTRGLRFAVPVLLVGLLLWAFGTGDIAARLTQADPVWVIVAVACLWAQTVLMALRWRLVAGSLGLRFGAGWAIREYLTGQVVNLTVPGGVLGDAGRAVRSRDATGWKPAAQAVVVERAAGQAGLLVVGVAGALWVAVIPDALNWPPGVVRGLLLAAVIGGAGIAGALLLARRTRIADLIRRCLPTRRIAGVHVVLSVGAALLNVVAFAACAWATGTALGAQAALLLVPLILTAMLIPLSVAGWGWREGAAALLFPVAGATAQAGIAAGIVFGAAMMLSVLPVLAFWLWPVAERTG